jgi:predicted nicotinamide N-methyase
VTTSYRSFVLRHTRLRPVPGLEGTRLHLADDVLALWRAVAVETRDPDAPLPYWAFAWGGGLAIARHLLLHPELVAGRRVFDLATGSGLCAIAAAGAGATAVAGADIDPFAAAAVRLNARANGRRVAVVERDVLDETPPDAEIVLAGDWAYEGPLAERVLPWLRRAAAAGADVLVGDPGRRYLPVADLEVVAEYEVRTTTALEDMERKRAWVYRLRATGRSLGGSAR